MAMKWLRQQLNKLKKLKSRLSPWTIIIIVFAVSIEAGLAVAIIYIFRTQGPTNAVGTLSAIAAAVAILVAAPGLLLAYLQWHEPRAPKVTPVTNNTTPPQQISSLTKANAPARIAATSATPVHDTTNNPSTPSNAPVQNARPPIFISYNKADSEKAEWINEVLNQAGYSTVLGVDVPGTNPVLETDEVLKAVKHTIIVVSPDYLKKNPEVWPNVFRTDKSSRSRALLPVYVRDSSDLLEKSILGGITPIDLRGKDQDEEAREALIDGIRLSIDGIRKRSNTPPVFPDFS